MKKFTTIITSLILMVFGLALVPANTHAAINCSDNTIPPSVLRANGCSSDDDEPELSDIIVNIINGAIGVLSVVIVIFIIVGGVNYMTSAGDPGKIEKAKKTILYAVVGAIICVLAFAITNFVIGALKNADSGSEIDGGGPISSVFYPED
ncbi:hypothetical protein J6S55_00360 [Candidatus Saccharibacteria bacterium]|nr:hypothetical protein [Candidatus Saccharibacteria bacterium]